MDELFKQLARGEMPNFLQMMTAIEEIGAMYPGCQDCGTNPACYADTKLLDRKNRKFRVEKPDKVQR